MRHKDVKIEIEIQGAPVINCAWVYKKSLFGGIVLIDMDLKSKYCDMIGHSSGSDGSCGICIAANERSLYLHEGCTIDDMTDIKFPEYKGFNIYATSSGRYTVRICLVKE